MHDGLDFGCGCVEEGYPKSSGFGLNLAPSGFLFRYSACCIVCWWILVGIYVLHKLWYRVFMGAPNRHDIEGIQMRMMLVQMEFVCCNYFTLILHSKI